MELTKKLKGGFCEIATADNFDIQRFAEPSLTLENGAYLITSAADLQTLAAYVNEGNNCKGLTLKLTKDLDLSGVDWTPIGNSAKKYFSGTFDGGGFALKNLTIDTNADKLGLFGYIYGGTVKNLTLENFSVTNNFNNAFASTGALTGYAETAAIKNVTVIGATITASKGYVGGLAGTAESGSKINNCYASNAGAQGSGNNINAAKLVTLGKTADFTDVTISGNYYTLGDSYGAGVGTNLTFTVPSNSYIENAEKTDDTTYTCTVAENSLPKFWEIKTLGSYTFDSRNGACFIRSASDFINFAAYVNGGGYALGADSVPFTSGTGLKNLNLLTPTSQADARTPRICTYNEDGTAATAELYRVANIGGITYTASNNAELIYFGNYVYAPTGITLNLTPDKSFNTVTFTQGRQLHFHNRKRLLYQLPLLWACSWLTPPRSAD